MNHSFSTIQHSPALLFPPQEFQSRHSHWFSPPEGQSSCWSVAHRPRSPARSQCVALPPGPGWGRLSSQEANASKWSHVKTRPRPRNLFPSEVLPKRTWYKWHSVARPREQRAGPSTTRALPYWELMVGTWQLPGQSPGLSRTSLAPSGWNVHRCAKLSTTSSYLAKSHRTSPPSLKTSEETESTMDRSCFSIFSLP